ncbi:MAG: vitamin K epoxide reductase family protein [Patescibacteria group bacterium]
MILNLICLALSVGGLYISYRIYKEKHSGKPMICPLNGKCEIVLTSKYGKIAGIGLEYFGMLFYGIILIGSNILLAEVWYSGQVSLILFIVACGGMLFTVYLTIIQKFVLKSWCTWCLSSAFTTSSVFVVLIIKMLLK